ncbi:MAG: hypothetical protein Q8928_06010 [Bacteroidota bacterium]|nr:hypothetical protein [Bacteroidota bacterium]
MKKVRRMELLVGFIFLITSFLGCKKDLPSDSGDLALKSTSTTAPTEITVKTPTRTGIYTPGGTANIQVTVYPSTAIQNYTISIISGSQYGTLANNVLTAKANGVVVIKAVTADGNHWDTCAVNIANQLQTVTTTTAENANYYVAPNGSDSNPGTISAPFASLNKAWSVVSAGQLIYVRGGTYKYTSYSSKVSLTGKSGISGKPIRLWNYPGETPVFDFSGCPGSSYQILFTINGDYLYLKGLKMIGAPQGSSGMGYGFYLNNSGYCTLEQIESTKIAGEGFRLTGTTHDCLILNCDAHHNTTPLDATPYGEGDGFHLGTSVGNNNVFRGCRSWMNSDDGWDGYGTSGTTLFDNCWSFWNGYRPESTTSPVNWVTGGDGDGFKGNMSKTGGITLTYQNCIAVHNRLFGFDKNETTDPEKFMNCTAVNNQLKGFHIYTTSASVLKNNISYKNLLGYGDIPTGTNINHNTWNLSVTVSNSDFVSVDESQFALPRKADGSLPDITAFKLTSSSPLRTQGISTDNVTATSLGALY